MGVWFIAECGPPDMSSKGGMYVEANSFREAARLATPFHGHEVVGFEVPMDDEEARQEVEHFGLNKLITAEAIVERGGAFHEIPCVACECCGKVKHHDLN